MPVSDWQKRATVALGFLLVSSVLAGFLANSSVNLKPSTELLVDWRSVDALLADRGREGDRGWLERSPKGERWIVVSTTHDAPPPGFRRLRERLRDGWKVVVVGDPVAAAPRDW